MLRKVVTSPHRDDRRPGGVVPLDDGLTRNEIERHPPVPQLVVSQHEELSLSLEQVVSALRHEQTDSGLTTFTWNNKWNKIAKQKKKIF